MREGSQKPAGPHTLSELQSMQQMGDLKADTMVAAGGDSEWVSLESLINAHAGDTAGTKLPPVPGVHVLPAVPGGKTLINVPESAGPCPNCGQEIPLHGQAVIPEHCPHCRFLLRAQNPDSLWQQFIVAMKKSFVLRGRATRMEYWGFYIFSLIFSWALTIPSYIIQFVTMTTEELLMHGDSIELYTDAAYWSSAAGIAQIAAYAISLVFVAPSISTMVRRFHDIGKSGWWLIGMYGLMILPLIIGILADLQGLSLVGILFAVFIFMLLGLVIGVIVLVWLCTDSQKGRNRYGASPKYPWL